MSAYSLPRDLEEDVVRLMYQRAEEVNWPYLTDSERTEFYRLWTEDPAVGGRLLPFMGKPENVRPWMKDVPMKEYARAANGVGKYAPLVARPAAPVDVLVHKALGSGWTADPASLRIKPLRVTIHRDDDEEEERHFVWGPARDFKHLSWAAIAAQADGDARPWVVCVVDSFVRPVSSSQKATHQRLALRLGLEIKHVTDG
jgi:hypothetical protein